MYYLFGVNTIEIILISIFLVIAGIVYFSVNNDYIKTKSLGWIYIIAFFYLFFLHPITNTIALIILGGLAISEFYRVLNFKKFVDYLHFIGFLFVISLFLIFIHLQTRMFFYLFIVVGFSDIIAYFVGKGLPYKRGFTKLSPNKTLSGVLGQIVFIFAVLTIASKFFLVSLDYRAMSIFLLIRILAPVGDLFESYYKRRASVKDMADYIPGHGGVLDRIDSILLSGASLGVYFLIIL